MTGKPVTVWGIGSTRTFRVHWTAIELDLDYEIRPIRSRTGETRTPAYRALNPKQKIPTLEHGNLVLTESAAIMRYLSRVFPGTERLTTPDDPPVQARIDEWISFVSMELDAHTLYILRRHRYLPEIYGAAPRACDSAVKYFLTQARAVEDRVPHHDYLVEGTFGLADILLVTILDWARRYEIDLPGTLSSYRDFVARRPGYQAAIRRNYPELGPDGTLP